MFATRAAAGRALASQVKPDADRTLQVLAVSREGIAVGVHVAAALGADISRMATSFDFGGLGELADVLAAQT